MSTDPGERPSLLDSVISWSIRRRLSVFAMAGALAAAGLFATIRLPVDVLPELTAPVVTIVTEAPGLPPEEVEAQVTLPLEAAMGGLSGIRRTRSASGVGISVVWIEFDWETEPFRARQVVTERVALADLRSAGLPVLAPQSSVMGEVMFLGLRSTAHDAMQLRAHADWVIRQRLLSVPGIAQVVPIGGEVLQYQVQAMPERLLAYGITFGELVDAMERGSANAAGGFVRAGHDQLLLETQARFRSLRDIEETVVTVRDREPVLVRHLAKVAVGAAPKLGGAGVNGEPAVVMPIQKQPGANTLELTARLDLALDELERSLPAGMILERNLFRQTTFIQTAVGNVQAALRDGALLVVLIVFLFLFNVRAALTSLVALPLSLLAAAIVLALLGHTWNVMTLGGITIAVGDLVDDAIIDVENIIRRLRLNAQLTPEMRRPIPAVVYDASREVRGSIVFATAIIVLVFLPLLNLGGIEERLLAPLAIAFIVSLGASLLVALTVTPAMSAALFRNARSAGSSHRYLATLRAGYSRRLDWALGRPRLVIGFAVLAFAVALGALSVAGRGFIPPLNEGALTINAVTLPGIAIEESERLAAELERALLEHPAIASVARRTGRAERDEHAQGPFASELEVALRAAPRNREGLVEELRARAARIEGLQLTFGQPISHRIDHLLSGSRANVAVKVFGEEVPELSRIAEKVRDLATAVPGFVDVSLELPPNIPTLSVRLDRIAMARVGLDAVDVTRTIEAFGQGVTVGVFREGVRTFDVVVRLGEERSAEALSRLTLKTRTGAEMPLSSVATLVRDSGPHAIGHENGARRAVVMANVSGRDLVSAVEELERSLQSALVLPDRYRFEIAGQYQNARAATWRLLLATLAVVAAMFALLYMAFRSLREALLVLLNLPLGLVGGAIGLYVSGGELNIATGIGFITLFGIAARNGIMLVSHVKYLRDREGLTDVGLAIRRGAEERLVPILMTALSAGLALIPLALRSGLPGSEIQGPMATVILFGLLTSTVLNLFVVPASYALTHRAR